MIKIYCVVRNLSSRVAPLRVIEDYVRLESHVNIFYRCIVPDSCRILVVLLHGYTAHSGLYTHIVKELASYGYCACSYDQRGHGRTARGGERGYVNSFNDFLVDLEHFTIYAQEKLGVEKSVLVGHSMGGLVVLLYAGKRGRVGDAVIGIAPAVLIPVKRTAGLITNILAAIAPRKRFRLPFTQKQTEELFGRFDKSLAEFITKEELELTLKDTTIRLLSEIWKASNEFWRYVEKISVPTLLIHGDEDSIIPVEASRKAFEKLKTGIKGLKIYPGKGHSPLHEVGWKDCVRDIDEWIKIALRY